MVLKFYISVLSSLKRVCACIEGLVVSGLQGTLGERVFTGCPLYTSSVPGPGDIR